MYTPLQEKDLLTALHEGSELAFEKIYHLYSARLFGKLLRLVKSEVHSKEILQDIFLKLWEKRQSIDPEKCFRSYLYKIAENKVYDFFRKAARDKSLQEQLILLSTANYDINENDEHLVALESAIHDIPPQRQKVFRLCKLEGKSYKEVSELLGISVSTISDHIVKSTKFIRSYFKEYNWTKVA